MERKEAIRSAYRLTGGNNFYDGMITCSTFSGKAVCRLVWDMNKAESDAYLEKALSGIPENFSGRLLEVPVGTGILTMPLYKTLPKADITCLDYSADMMGQAQEKTERLHLQNVTFQQGDVGALPFADSAFDLVLSLNGFHDSRSHLRVQNMILDRFCMMGNCVLSYKNAPRYIFFSFCDNFMEKAAYCHAILTLSCGS